MDIINKMVKVLDKNDSIERIKSGDKIILEIGCGNNKRDPNAIGIDILDSPCTDIIGDACEILRLLPDNSVDRITSNHVLEHLEDLPLLLTQVVRVLKPSGKMTATVPHFSNAFFYSDPTHKCFFGLYTFSYYFDQSIFSRTVPSYSRISGARLNSVRLGFRSYRPHYISHLIRKGFGLLVNSSNMVREIYEESFSTFISCYEITYEVEKCRLP